MKVWHRQAHHWEPPVPQGAGGFRYLWEGCIFDWPSSRSFFKKVLTKGFKFYRIKILRFWWSERSLKIRFNEPISVNIGKSRVNQRHSKNLRSSRFEGKPKDESICFLFQFRRRATNRDWTKEFDPGSDWTLAACFTHASRTAAQGACSRVASGARVSNTSERVLLWGITGRKTS